MGREAAVRDRSLRLSREPWCQHSLPSAHAYVPPTYESVVAEGRRSLVRCWLRQPAEDLRNGFSESGPVRRLRIKFESVETL